MRRRRNTSARSRQVTFETLESRELLAAVWRNPVDSLDVNNDRQITAFDALGVINELNLTGIIDPLPAIKPAGEPFLDVTGNNALSAFDALAVINQLNLRGAGKYLLKEAAGKIADQQSVTITAGTIPAGTRTYQLMVQPQFDTTDTQSATEDLFAVFLLDRATGETVIDAGTPGSSLFSLRGAQATVHNGLVQWDGTFLSIDLTQIAAETLELRLQLLNPDADTGSQVTVTPWSNVVDPLGVPRTPGTLRSPPLDPAGALTAADLNKYLQMPTLRVELENAVYNETTGFFTAEARLLNDTEATVTNGIVRLPGVSAPVVVNRSGQHGTVPYWNFAPVIGAAGLAPGAKSDWLRITLRLQGQSFLWRPDVRGFSSTEHLAPFGVFSTTFAEAQERQIFHMPLAAGEQFLSLRMKSAATTVETGADVRLLKPNGAQAFPYPTNYYDWSFRPYTADMSGDYQFEMIAQVPGDYAVAFQKLGNLPVLTLGSELQGYLDPRLGSKVFAFYGVAGQRLVFENRHPNDATQFMNWYVIDAYYGDGANFIAEGAGGDLEVELSYDGLHYLLLNGSGSSQFQPFDYILRSPVRIEQPLQLGESYSAAFQTFSEERRYTFTGTLGQRVVMDLLVPANPNVEVSLLNANGLPVAFQAFQPVLIDVAGTWTLVVKGNPPDFFQFYLRDVADLNSFTHGGTFGATQLTRDQSVFFRVPASRGQVLTFVNNNGGAALTQLFSPSGKPYAPTAAHQFPVTESGVSLLRIYTTEPTPVDYLFTLQVSFEAPVTAAGLDTDFTGSVTPGATTVGTFAASAGSQLLFDKFAVAGDTSGFSVRITGPGFDQTFTKDSGVITLHRSGTYSLQAINSGATAVPYGFRIIDLLATPLLSDGERINTTLSGGRTFVRRVAGTVGDFVLLASLDGSSQDDLTIQLQTEFGASALRADGLFQSTKTHFVTIEQETPADRPLNLQASLTAGAELLPIGTTFSGTLGPAGGAKVYQFHGLQGQTLHFDTLALSGPVNARVFNNSSRQLSLTAPTWFFTRNGKHYLSLETAEATPVTYTIRSSYLPTSPTPIALNTVISGTLGVGEARTYSLDLPADSILYFDGLDETSPPAHVRAVGPNGGEFAQLTTATNIMFREGQPGRYTFTISDSTQPYSFRIIDARTAPYFALNQNVLGTIAADEQARVWRIPGLESQRLYVDSNASVALPFLGSMTLYDNYGNLDATTSATTNNDIGTTASINGDLFLVINAASAPFNYDLRVRTSETAIVPISLGTTISGVLSDPGDTVEYTFNGTRGQHIHLEGLTNGSFRIVTPDNDVLPTTEGFGSLLPASGQYRIRVFSGANQVNMDYRFELVDVATLPLLPLNTVISGSTTQGEWLMYRLPGVNGSRYAFDQLHFAGPTTNNSWRLITPQATFAFPPAPFIDGDRTFTLTDNGDYIFVVRLSGGAIDYAFRVDTVSQPAVTVAGLNQTYNSSVANSDVVTIPFTGTAGQRVYLDVLGQFSLPATRVLGPDGSVVDAAATSDRMLVLPLSGAYTLEFTGSGSPTPRNFSFRLIDASALPLTPHDTPFAVNLQTYRTEIYAFNATAGDQFSFELAGAPTFGNYSVVQPDGKLLAFGPDPHILWMPQTGRHYLVINTPNIGPPLNTVGHIWNTYNLPLIANEDPITVNFAANEWHFFSFDLRPGDRVYFVPVTPAPVDLQFAFIRPRGLQPTVSLDDAVDPDAFTVTRAGRHTLVIGKPSTTPADFTFQIHIVPLKEVFGVARG